MSDSKVHAWSHYALIGIVFAPPSPLSMKPSICLSTYLSIYLFIYLPHRVACGNLVPQAGIEPAPPAVEAWSLNHWTTKEVLKPSF